MTSREQALANYLDIPVSEVEQDDYSFTANGEEWVIYTYDEAEARCAEDIKETLWAFNGHFLQDYMPLDAEDIDTLRGGRGEDVNPAFLKLVGDEIGVLVSDAISLDGRGHFLSHYDGEEVELEGDFYAYRVD